MTADNIVSLNRHKSGPDSELVQSGAKGEARLRELERLIQTAAQVQAQAEAELSQTTASQSVAQQRKAAADSVRRKAEAEMAKLRNELARQAARTKQVWSPGDPIKEKRPDFEISTLTGSASRGRFSDSAFRDSELELDDDNAKMNSRINSTGGSGRKKSKRKSVAYHQPKRSKRGWAIAILMLLGISAGAAFTWMSVQNPDAISNKITAISDRVSSLIPVGEEATSPSPQTGETLAQPAAEEVAEAKAQATRQQAQAEAAWQQAIALQEQRVRDKAALRFNQNIQ